MDKTGDIKNPGFFLVAAFQIRWTRLPEIELFVEGYLERRQVDTIMISEALGCKIKNRKINNRKLCIDKQIDGYFM